MLMQVIKQLVKEQITITNDKGQLSSEDIEGWSMKLKIQRRRRAKL